MTSLVRHLRYAMRQFRAARVFTITAVLTLALGIGGTTAIFTLIHAVMLRSLPVGDPARLHRLGDGDACCVQGGPQDRWGMFSYPLFERLKSATPEFEALTAFQAAGARASVRRDDESVPRPLRSEYVTGNYFATLGVNAFTGRVFTASDDTPAAPPTVVLSYHAWKRIEFQSHFVRGLLLVTNTPAGTLEPQVKRALADTDPNLTVTSVRSLRQQIERSFDQQRAVASLAGLFGVVALALAAIGLYGVTAYSVARRRNEIGIRMALGADRGQVVGLVLRGAFRRVVIGLVLGLPLAVGAGYLLSAQLYGLQFWDPAALSLAAVALGIAAFVASIVPAARAATIAPMKALRIE